MLKDGIIEFIHKVAAQKLKIIEIFFFNGIFSLLIMFVAIIVNIGTKKLTMIALLIGTKDIAFIQEKTSIKDKMDKSINFNRLRLSTSSRFFFILDLLKINKNAIGIDTFRKIASCRLSKCLSDSFTIKIESKILMQELFKYNKNAFRLLLSRIDLNIFFAIN